MAKLIDSTVPKFLLVGVINTIVGAGTMFLLYNLVHCSYWFSSAANYVVGGIVSFFLNKYFTFQNKVWSWGQVVKFTVNLLICYLAGYGIAKEAAELVLSGLDVVIRENIAMLVGMCLYTVLNYFGQRFWAFR
ncbi:GtrA family protein [Mailhella sp.]